MFKFLKKEKDSKICPSCKLKERIIIKESCFHCGHDYTWKNKDKNFKHKKLI